MSTLSDLISLLGEAFTRCEFRDNTHRPANSPSHSYLTIRLTDPDNLMLVMISSQLEKVADFARFNRTEAGVVLLEQDSLGFLNKRSIVNCNKPVYGTPETIAKRIDEEAGGFLISTRTYVPEAIQYEIYRALRASPILTPRMKATIFPIPAPPEISSD